MTLQVSGANSNSMAFGNNYDRIKLYDWLLILPQEVKHIWRAPWNWSKALYLLTRYTPFVTMALVYRSELLPHRLVHPPAHFLLSGTVVHVSRYDLRFHDTLSFDRLLLTSPCPLDHFSPNPTPDSCKRTFYAISCRCLYFILCHLTPFSAPLSDCLVFVLCAFQGSRSLGCALRKVCATGETANRAIKHKSHSVSCHSCSRPQNVCGLEKRQTSWNRPRFALGTRSNSQRDTLAQVCRGDWL